MGTALHGLRTRDRDLRADDSNGTCRDMVVRKMNKHPKQGTPKPKTVPMPKSKGGY